MPKTHVEKNIYYHKIFKEAFLCIDLNFLEIFILRNDKFK